MTENQQDENIFKKALTKIVAFWPLFLILCVIALSLAWVYLQFATPYYESSATLIIKDQKKGVNDSKIMESINQFESKKIVENEIEVIRSRSVTEQVVSKLHLYADVFEEKTLKPVSAYTTSPISIEIKSPENIPLYLTEEGSKFYFSFDSSDSTVVVGSKHYPMNQWVNLQGIQRVKFVPNKNQSNSKSGPFYFQISNPRLTVGAILSELTVKATNKLSSVVTLSYKDPVPLKAENILNTLITVYNNNAESERNILAKNTLDFIEERLANLEIELEVIEAEIEKFRSTKGAVNLSEQSKMYLEDVGVYDRQISEMTRQKSVLNRVEQYVLSKNSEAGIVPSTIGVNDPVLSRLLENLYDSETKYSKLSKTAGEQNPVLVTIENEIEGLRPSILENIRNQKNNLQTSLNNLNSSSNSSNSALKVIPAMERELLEITRRKTNKSNLLDLLQQKREEAALAYAPTTGDARMVDSAQSSLVAVSPKSLVAYLFALIAALSIGISYAYGKELLSTKVLFRSEIGKSSKKMVIAELPFVSKEEIDDNSKSSEGLLPERFRRIGARLGLYDTTNTKKQVLVTSSIAGEGKSFISINLAKTLADAGKKVVLVDLDFLEAYTSNFYGISDKIGIYDFLSGKISWLEIIHKASNYLDVIAIGKPQENYTRLLLNGKLESFFTQLATQYDYIILDAPPIELVADVNLLAKMSDKTLFVVRHAYTPNRVLRNLDTSMNAIKESETIEIIFNGVKKRGIAKSSIDYSFGYD